MKYSLLTFSILLTLGCLFACNQTKQLADTIPRVESVTNSHLGKWVRIGHFGPMSLEFKEGGIAEIDFGNDQTIEVISAFHIQGDTITFTDKEGKMCPYDGYYIMDPSQYYLAFDLIDDACNARIKSTMGFWTRPDFKNTIDKLDKEIAEMPDPALYLIRARIYMATAQSRLAKSDFNKYLAYDKSDPRVFVNRAGASFPNDMEGVVKDCEMAIKLEPTNKNAYFLKGLALYELGEKENACKSFSKAIELGFSILRIAEQEKCAQFWDKENKK